MKRILYICKNIMHLNEILLSFVLLTVSKNNFREKRVMGYDPIMFFKPKYF